MDDLPEPELRFLRDLKSWTAFDGWKRRKGWKMLGKQRAAPWGVTLSKKGEFGADDPHTHVVVIKLADNGLRGEIPGSVGAVCHLRVLWLNGNQLSGAIPGRQLSGLRKLESLRLSGNQLEGEIPHELGYLTALTELFLGTNRLSGAIPATLGSLTKLRELALHNNLLTGAARTASRRRSRRPWRRCRSCGS